MAFDVRAAIKEGRIRPTKSIGQCFLCDRNVAERIVALARLAPGERVLEVGPGACALTALLCEQAGAVTAVEIDKHLLPVIEESMRGRGNFRLVHADILKAGIEGLTGGLPYKLVSNLPYYITSQVLMRFLEAEADLRPSVMVLMMQKEVADRLVARPGGKDYGQLTVAVAYRAVAERAFEVPPHCFVPQPGVQSCVVVLAPHAAPPVQVDDEDLFFRVVRAAFAQRRKTLENCLLHAGFFAAGGRAGAAATLERAGIPAGARGETLDLAGFARLANGIHRARCACHAQASLLE